MCFIRKGLDFIFTQEELKWLDQILPSTKRKPFPRSLVTSVPSNNDFNKVSCLYDILNHCTLSSIYLSIIIIIITVLFLFGLFVGIHVCL